MVTIRTTFTLQEALSSQAHELGINISAAAREGVAEAVRRAKAQSDRDAYLQNPEQDDEFWNGAETWGEA